MKLSIKIKEKDKFTAVKSLFGPSSGYDTVQVDDFLDEIYLDSVKLENELEHYKAQLDNLLEEQKMRSDLDGLDGEEEYGTFKEALLRKIEQAEFFQRAHTNAYYQAEEIVHKMKKEAEEKALRIEKEAEERSRTLLEKTNQRKKEIEMEISVLMEKEKEMRERLLSFSETIQSVMNG